MDCSETVIISQLQDRIDALEAEIAQLSSLPEQFAKTYHVRGDHKYSGVTIHDWLVSVTSAARGKE